MFLSSYRNTSGSLGELLRHELKGECFHSFEFPQTFASVSKYREDTFYSFLKIPRRNALIIKCKLSLLVPLCFSIKLHELARAFSLGYFLKTFNYCLYCKTHSNMLCNMFSDLPCRQYRLGICEQTLWSLLITLPHPYSEPQQERAGEPVQGPHIVPQNLRPKITLKGSRKYSVTCIVDS